jgi:Na+-driven multidrug efflux pump
LSAFDIRFSWFTEYPLGHDCQYLVVVNVGLDYHRVWCRWSFDGMGLTGAAIASLIAVYHASNCVVLLFKRTPFTIWIHQWKPTFFERTYKTQQQIFFLRTLAINICIYIYRTDMRIAMELKKLRLMRFS